MERGRRRRRQPVQEVAELPATHDSTPVAAQDHYGNAEVLGALQGGATPLHQAIREGSGENATPVPTENVEALRRVAGWTSASEAAPEAGPTVGPTAGGPVAELVRQVSPFLGQVLDYGLAGLVRPDLSAGIDALVQAALGEVQLGSIEPFLAELGSAVGMALEVATSDPQCCERFDGWLQLLVGLPERWLFGPSVDGVLGDVAGLEPGLGAVGAILAGDVAGFLAQYAPTVAATLDQVLAAIETVRGWDAAAGDWVAATLGLEGGAGLVGLLETLWDELLGAATSAVDAAIDLALGAVFAFPPLEVAYRVVDAASDVGDAARWLAGNWGDPEALARAPEAMANNVFAGFVVGGLELSEALAAFVDAVGSAGLALAGALDSMIAAATGVEVLAPLAAVLAGARELVGWLADSPLWADLGAIGASFVSWGASVLVHLVEVLLSLPFALAPPLFLDLLASEAFGLLPACYRAAIFDVLARFAVVMWDQLGLAALTLALGPLGDGMVAVVHTGMRAVLGALTEGSDEEKAAFLQALVSLLSPTHIVEFTAGVVSGLFWGFVGPLVDLGGLALSLGLVPVELLGAALGAVGAGFEGIDAAGDRVFEPAGATTPEKEPEETGGLDDAMVELVTSLRDGVGELAAMRPEALAELFTELVTSLAEGVGALAGEVVDGLVDLATAAMNGLYAMGYGLGQLASMLCGGAILKALGTLGKGIRGLEVLLDLLRVPTAVEGAVEAVATTSLGLLRDAVSALVKLPGMGRVLAAVEAVWRALGRWLAGARRIPVAGAVVRLHDAAAGIGRDAVRELVRRVAGDEWAGHDELVDFLVARVEALKGAATIPSWYNPAKSAEENLEAYLTDCIKGWFEEREEEGGDEEGGEEQDEDDEEGGPLPPDAAAVVSVARSLRPVDLREVAEQAVPLVGVPSGEDWEDWVERGAALAGAAAVALALTTERAGRVPDGFDPARTVHQNVIALLVVPTANALAEDTPSEG